MRIRILITPLLFSACTVNAASLEVDKDKILCGSLFQSYLSSLQSCSDSLPICISGAIELLGKKSNFREVISEQNIVNHYGYTYINTTPISSTNSKYTIADLDRFRGDRRSRLMESRIVRTDKLEAVFALPPGPMKYLRDSENKPLIDREVNADEFSEALSDSVKISNFSVILYKWGKRSFFVNNKYDMDWLYGASVTINSLREVEVIEILPDSILNTLCMYSFSEQDQEKYINRNKR